MDTCVFIMLFSFNICWKFFIIKEKYMIGYISKYIWCFVVSTIRRCILSSDLVCIRKPRFYLCFSQKIALLFFWKTLWIIELNLFAFVFWYQKALDKMYGPPHSCIFHSFHRAEVTLRWTSFPVLSIVFHQQAF